VYFRLKWVQKFGHFVKIDLSWLHWLLQEITACKAAVEAFMSGALPQSKLKPAEATHIGGQVWAFKP
jgi:hypothetical protein